MEQIAVDKLHGTNCMEQIAVDKLHGTNCCGQIAVEQIAWNELLWTGTRRRISTNKIGFKTSSLVMKQIKSF